MNRESIFKAGYYFALGTIILFSFFHHSSLFSPFLNSDDAVVPLMIFDFKLPQDLYYWSANRFGSLIPLVGQFFYKILHFSPIQSEAIIHYLLLIAGVLGYASIFKSKIIRLIFVAVWFLPPLRMIDVLKLSQGEQYALIGMAVYFINKLYLNHIGRYGFKEYIYLTCITLIFIASIWVSDLAVITIGIIIAVYGLRYVRKKQAKKYNAILKKPELYFIILGFIAMALFLYFAKTNAPRQENYYEFFNPKTIHGSIRIFLSTIRDLLLFKSNEPFTSLYSYLLIIGIFIITLQFRKIKLIKIDRKWATIFALDFAFVLIIILSSKWANANGVPRRYFVCNYISFWLVFLLAVDNIQGIKKKWLLHGFIAATVLLGGLGTIYHFKYISPKSLKPTIKTASEFKSLGKIGLIAEYWNSYINSAPDPENIKATPHDKSAVRKQSLVDSVFSQPEIYIIRDMWMDSFPDTLVQFGYNLLKDGNEFSLANCQVCKYKKIKLNKTFALGKLKYNTSNLVTEIESNKKVLYFSPNCQSCIEKHVVNGPYIPIGMGNFKARFYVKTDPIINDDTIALLEITADAGMTKLVSKKISLSDFNSPGEYEYIDLEFKTSKGYNNIESRIYYYGNADLFFEHIKLIEK